MQWYPFFNHNKKNANNATKMKFKSFFPYFILCKEYGVAFFELNVHNVSTKMKIGFI